MNNPRYLRIFLAAGLAVAALPLAAQETKPITAVLPFRAVEVSPAAARSASVFVETALVNTGGSTVVTHTERDRILEAQEAALADCTGVDCAVRIGKLLSVTQIVVGEVVGLGKRLIVNVKLIDVSTGRVLAADTQSAEGEQGLEQVCRELTSGLTGKALSGVAVAAPAEEGGAAQGQAAAASAEPGAAEGRAAEIPAEEPGQKRRPRRQKAPGAAAAALSPAQRTDRAARLAGTSAILMQTGSMASAVSFELGQTSSEAYQRYLQATADVQDFYAKYAWAYAGHLGLALGADGLWAGGAAASAAAVFKYPGEAYALSRAGRGLFTASWSLVLAGNVLGFLAGNQYFNNEALYQEYLNASTGIEEARGKYEAGHAWYLAERILSYSFWGLGAAGMVCSPLLPGDKAALLSGPKDRWLMAGGTTLVAAGSLFHSLALNTRELAASRYERYLAASADAADFYASYRSAYIQHVVYGSLAYALWAGGGLAVLGAIYLTPDRAKPQKEPKTTLLLLPQAGGLTILVSIDPKGVL